MDKIEEMRRRKAAHSKLLSLNSKIYEVPANGRDHLFRWSLNQEAKRVDLLSEFRL